MSAHVLLARLSGVQGRGPRWRAICPAHPSRHNTRSLSILETDDGRVLLHCHAGCSLTHITHTVGVEISDLFPPRDALRESYSKPKIVKPWRVAEVVNALRADLALLVILVSDAASGLVVSREDASRAIDRVGHFLDELDYAH